MLAVIDLHSQLVAAVLKSLRVIINGIPIKIRATKLIKITL